MNRKKLFRTAFITVFIFLLVFSTINIVNFVLGKVLYPDADFNGNNIDRIDIWYAPLSYTQLCDAIVEYPVQTGSARYYRTFNVSKI
jgi:hypothetical protein